jgi:protein-disulfide isomerase
MKTNLVVFACALLFVCTVVAQSRDNPALRPPKGAEVAIVVFEDLECPDCARAAPLLEEAARTYHIPMVVHDFPLQIHPWAYDGAVLAKYFDSHSKKLGSDFRETVFQHQMEITKDNLHAFGEKFAADHKIDLPFAVDPQGKFAAEVDRDRDIGNSVGLDHTPTIYVVSNKKIGKPFVEVVDRSQLFQLIDSMKQGE